MSSLGVPAVSTEQLRRALERSGFVRRHGSGGHLHYVRDGLRVTLPSNEAEINRKTLRRIAQGIGLTPGEFRAWVSGKGEG